MKRPPSELLSPQSIPPTPTSPLFSLHNAHLALLLLLGIGAMALGLYQLVPPTPTTYTDPIPPAVAAQAVSDWNTSHLVDSAPAPLAIVPSPSPLPSPIPSPVAAPPADPPSAPTGPGVRDYLLFSFPRLGLAAVAGNGDWSMLNYREAAHWYASPAPGSVGNSLIAFHRGAAFANAAALHAGDIITIQDKAGHTYSYSVQYTTVVSPSNATPYFDQTNDGKANLTMLTCDPYRVWNNRLIIRATLIS